MYMAGVMESLLLLLLSLLVLATSQTKGRVASEDAPPDFLPSLIAAGSHYEVGQQIGSTFKTQILSTMARNSFFNEKMLPYNLTSEGAELYNSFLDSSARAFPAYLEEIRGMADGTNLSFSKVFLWNLKFEWQMLLEPSTGRRPPSACSDILLIPEEGKATIGHNEDGFPVDASTSYLVHSRITTDLDPPVEFWAYCYPGELCGKAFGFNKYGIAFTVNAVFPKTANNRTVARNFINRAILDASSFDEARQLLRTPCSSGFSMNVGSMKTMEISNFEVSTYRLVETKVTSYSYHFNMYIHSDVPQYTDPSSQHRLARVQELPRPLNDKDILDILGDTEDPKYPIYRTATPPDDGMTIATGLFDLSNGTLSIYRGNPTTSPALVVLSRPST